MFSETLTPSRYSIQASELALLILEWNSKTGGTRRETWTAKVFFNVRLTICYALMIAICTAAIILARLQCARAVKWYIWFSSHSLERIGALRYNLGPQLIKTAYTQKKYRSYLVTPRHSVVLRKSSCRLAGWHRDIAGISRGVDQRMMNQGGNFKLLWPNSW